MSTPAQQKASSRPEPMAEDAVADFPAEAANDVGQVSSEHYPFSTELSDEAGPNEENAAQFGGDGPRVDDLGYADLQDRGPDEAKLQENLSAMQQLHSQDTPLFDQSMQAPSEQDSHSVAHHFEQPGGGYLIVLTEGSAMQAELYDESLQFISEIDLDSDAASHLLDNAEEAPHLDETEIESLFGDLTPDQRRHARVYRIRENIMNDRDAEIEEVMLENDDELPYGYNDEEDDEQ